MPVPTRSYGVLIKRLAMSAWLLGIAVAAFADSGSPPHPPTLDPPSIARDAAASRSRSGLAAFGPYNHGEPSAQEQYMLELVNRARADPPAEGWRLQATTDPDILNAYSYFQVDLARLVADFAGYPARPPLAFNANLIAAARGHSQDMAVNNFQGHVGSNGSTLSTRIDAAGYTGWNALAENVYAYAEGVFYGHAGFNVDWGVPSLGHRRNIMNYSTGDPVYTEIGIGIVDEASPSTAVGPLIVTEDFGRRSGQHFVVGVVYRDFDDDGFYSIGEGVGGITVTTSEGDYAHTSASGGYAIPLAGSSGSIEVRAEGAALGAAQEHWVSLAGNNVKVDFVVPESGSMPLSVARAGTGAGTVTSDPLGILCGAVCDAWYAPGTLVTLIATPSAGSLFDGWTGACGGTQFCSLSMALARGLAATFTFVGAGSASANEWVQKSYVAYYGRPADPPGLAYWALRMDSEGGSLASIIASFGTSDEFNRRYGALGYVDLVTRIYQQALGRDPEPSGLNFYVSELQAGRRTLQSITLDVLNGATGADAVTVANRLDVANHYTGKVARGCSYGGEQTGVATLATVTPDPATSRAAKTDIEVRCGP